MILSKNSEKTSKKIEKHQKFKMKVSPAIICLLHESNNVLFGLLHCLRVPFRDKLCLETCRALRLYYSHYKNYNQHFRFSGRYTYINIYIL